MRLRKILIGDFCGFPQHEVLDLGPSGKNLLVYGENGAGKSTIFKALDQFFLSSVHGTQIRQFKNLFLRRNDPAYTPDVHVKLVFGPLVAGEVGDIPANTYEWTDGSIPNAVPVVRSTAKLPSRLDYRALLQTHFVHRSSRHVDLYDLLVTALLPDLANDVSGYAFLEELNDIRALRKKVAKEAPGAVRDALIAELNNVLQDHGAGLSTLCVNLGPEVKRLLSYFKDGQSVRFEVVAGSYDEATGQLTLPEVRLRSRLHTRHIPMHHIVINEARLTAIGLCIHFAAVRRQAAVLDDLAEPHLKLLVLDDVLIGLDMGNRWPIIKMIQKEFSSWQVVILTHDFTWYEMVRMHVGDAEWSVYELYRCFDVDRGFDRPAKIPFGAGWPALLTRAETYLAAHDSRAAAVYARAAFEGFAKNRADKKDLPVAFSKDSRNPKIDKIWTSIVSSCADPATGVPTPGKQGLINNLALCRKIVLNPWSHGTGAPVTEPEVQAAIDAVKALAHL